MYDCQANSSETGIPNLLKQIVTVPLMGKVAILMRYLLAEFPVLLSFPTQMHFLLKKFKHELGCIAEDAWKGIENTGEDLYAKLLDALGQFDFSNLELCYN